MPQPEHLKNEKADKIYVLDANVLFLGVNINLMDAFIYTAPSIINEIEVEKYKEKNRNILNILQAAITSKKLKVKAPSKKYLLVVEEQSKKTGDIQALSHADKDLLALTLELMETQEVPVILYTNDYSMENVCIQMNLPYSPVKKNGISKKITWQIYCPVCNTLYKPEQFKQKCEICGSRILRRPINK
ncbi:MAG: NOB1 family endonuclease [Promethearchaeota archaeon]